MRSYLQVLFIFCILSGATDANIFGDIFDTIGGWFNAFQQHYCTRLKDLRNSTVQFNGVEQSMQGFYHGYFLCNERGEGVTEAPPTTPEYTDWYYESWEEFGFMTRKTADSFIYKLRRM